MQNVQIRWCTVTEVLPSLGTGVSKFRGIWRNITARTTKGIRKKFISQTRLIKDDFQRGACSYPVGTKFSICALTTHNCILHLLNY